MNQTPCGNACPQICNDPALNGGLFLEGWFRPYEVSEM